MRTLNRAIVQAFAETTVVANAPHLMPFGITRRRQP
jgi:hypothetical protein